MANSNDNDPTTRPARAKQPAKSGTRDKLSAAYGATRERASAATQRATQGIEEAPLAILAGGLALGAIAGALLPRTDREVETLGPLGRKITDAASDAARAARDAGKEELGLFTDAPTSPLQAIVNKALGAVTAAGGAAAKSVGGANASEPEIERA